MEDYRNPFGMMSSVVRDVEAGIIAAFSGGLGAIPDGWALCDGTNGTPDLRNQFVPGAGDTFSVGANGGATTHTHGFVGNGHTHSIDFGGEMGAGFDYTAGTTPSSAVGTTDAGSSLPPYYALAYIMRL